MKGRERGFFGHRWGRKRCPEAAQEDTSSGPTLPEAPPSPASQQKAQASPRGPVAQKAQASPRGLRRDRVKGKGGSRSSSLTPSREARAPVPMPVLAPPIYDRNRSEPAIGSVKGTGLEDISGEFGGAGEMTIQKLAIRHQMQLIRNFSAGARLWGSQDPEPGGGGGPAAALYQRGNARIAALAFDSSESSSLASVGDSEDQDWGGAESGSDDGKGSAGRETQRSRAPTLPSSSSPVGASEDTPKLGSTRALGLGLQRGGAGARPRKQPLHIEVASDVDEEQAAAADRGIVYLTPPASRSRRSEDGSGAGSGDEAAVYSTAGGNFDFGGFRIGNQGLLSSPRNRAKRRPALNEGDNFIILARLGSGSSSSVHKALHLPTMRLVALKALPLYDSERRAQMMRELKILYSNLATINSTSPSALHRRRQAQAQAQTQAPALGSGSGGEASPVLHKGSPSPCASPCPGTPRAASGEEVRLVPQQGQGQGQGQGNYAAEVGGWREALSPPASREREASPRVPSALAQAPVRSLDLSEHEMVGVDPVARAEGKPIAFDSGTAGE
jgi:hypothetical protein